MLRRGTGRFAALAESLLRSLAGFYRGSDSLTGPWRGLFCANLEPTQVYAQKKKKKKKKEEEEEAA